MEQHHTVWQLQAAKARFSELFRLARSKGPQWVSKQGKEMVVVIPAEQFDELMKRKSGPGNLVDFFARSPLAEYKVALHRDKDAGRDIDL